MHYTIDNCMNSFNLHHRLENFNLCDADNYTSEKHGFCSI